MAQIVIVAACVALALAYVARSFYKRLRPVSQASAGASACSSCSQCSGCSGG